MASHDLVIRNGTVVDGTGAARRVADVAVSNGIVTEVGDVDGRGAREIDADGDRLVHEFFFTRNDPNETQMSEDVAFCWLCRKHGIPIFIAPWVKLGHMGTYTFRGTPVIVDVKVNKDEL